MSESECEGKQLCPCVRCRTRLLTTTLSLCCHHCRSGFLVHLDESHEYVCVDCRKHFGPLDFIVRICARLEEDFQSWCTEFASNHQVLDQMTRFYRQLQEVIYKDSLRLVRMGVEMARAYNTVDQFDESAEVTHQVIRSVMRYHPEAINIIGDLRNELKQIWTKHYDKVSEEKFAQYRKDASLMFGLLGNFKLSGDVQGE